MLPLDELQHLAEVNKRGNNDLTWYAWNVNSIGMRLNQMASVHRALGPRNTLQASAELNTCNGSVIKSGEDAANRMTNNIGVAVLEV